VRCAADTRKRLVAELRLMKGKQIDKPWRKHSNMPL
jgi:hypothetical protein